MKNVNKVQAGTQNSGQKRNFSERKYPRWTYDDVSKLRSGSKTDQNGNILSNGQKVINTSSTQNILNSSHHQRLSAHKISKIAAKPIKFNLFDDVLAGVTNLLTEFDNNTRKM